MHQLVSLLTSCCLDRSPDSLVDDLLGRPAQAAVGPVDWVRQHRLWLQEAHHMAFDQLNRAAAERAHFTDKRAAEHALQVGDHVYLRNRVLGRNKIQDFWRPELHQVTSPFRRSTRTHDEACGRWSRAHGTSCRHTKIQFLLLLDRHQFETSYQ